MRSKIYCPECGKRCKSSLYGDPNYFICLNPKCLVMGFRIVLKIDYWTKLEYKLE